MSVVMEFIFTQISHKFSRDVAAGSKSNDKAIFPRNTPFFLFCKFPVLFHFLPYKSWGMFMVNTVYIHIKMFCAQHAQATLLHVYHACIAWAFVSPICEQGKN